MTEGKLRVRVAMPDLWREQRMEFAPDTPVSQVKHQALPALLQESDVDTSDYYVEYFEKEVLDETRTLADLGVPPNGVILLRPYDMDHPAPFNG
ncbi:MAG: hypothetical protein PVJ43_01785 [Gemmatimonadales bacterium]|jgi:hypothetical protein